MCKKYSAERPVCLCHGFSCLLVYPGLLVTACQVTGISSPRFLARLTRPRESEDVGQGPPAPHLRGEGRSTEPPSSIATVRKSNGGGGGVVYKWPVKLQKIKFPTKLSHKVNRNGERSFTFLAFLTFFQCVFNLTLY